MSAATAMRPRDGKRPRKTASPTGSSHSAEKRLRRATDLDPHGDDVRPEEGQKPRIRSETIRSAGHSPLAVRTIPYFALTVLFLAVVPAPAIAQFGGLRDLVRGARKGEVYGLDVRELRSAVFVVDFSIPVELTAEQRGQLREYLAQEVGQYAQRRVLEEGGEYAAMMAGPAGSIVKSAIEKRRDVIGQARRQVKAGIDGLSDDQRFGLVTFESEPRLWHVDLVDGSEDHRDEAKGVVQRAQGGDESQGVLGFGMSLAKESLLAASGLALHQETMVAAQPPASARFAPSAEALLRGIEEAIELGPEAIVLVVGAPPIGVSPDEFVAEIVEENEARTPIHIVEFGTDEGSALYRALAERSGGTYRTAK